MRTSDCHSNRVLKRLRYKRELVFVGQVRCYSCPASQSHRPQKLCRKKVSYSLPVDFPDGGAIVTSPGAEQRLSCEGFLNHRFVETRGQVCLIANPRTLELTYLANVCGETHRDACKRRGRQSWISSHAASWSVHNQLDAWGKNNSQNKVTRRRLQKRHTIVAIPYCLQALGRPLLSNRFQWIEARVRQSWKPSARPGEMWRIK